MSRGGGQPLLWQHLFWIFGHPWVYALVLPAMGIVSDALPVFCRRPLVGYTLVAISTVATMILGFGVWVHHMFATGLPVMSLSFFSRRELRHRGAERHRACSAWIATIWTGKLQFTTPFLFFAGFVMLFVIGGVSGFMTASVALDWQLTDTYFIVAHLHYVLLGINVFPVIGGIYFWFPKMSGRMLDERLGQVDLLDHVHRLQRRVLPDAHQRPDGHAAPRLYLSGGAGRRLAQPALEHRRLRFRHRRPAVPRSTSPKACRSGAPAGNNPWDAPTLEWATTSPPPVYNFATIPQIASRYPLWEDSAARRTTSARSSATLARDGMVLDQGKETIGVTPLDAEPNVVLKMPGDSLLPFLLAIGMAGPVLRPAGAADLADGDRRRSAKSSSSRSG